MLLLQDGWRLNRLQRPILLLFLKGGIFYFVFALLKAASLLLAAIAQLQLLDFLNGLVQVLVLLESLKLVWVYF